jgi:hypothetical protein
MALGRQVLLCTLVALLMAHLIEKRDAHLAGMSQPTTEPTRLPLQSPQDVPMDVESQPTSAPTQPPLQSPQDVSMDVDAALPCLHSLLSSSAPRALPFPGKLVDGVREVVYLNL